MRLLLGLVCCVAALACDGVIGDPLAPAGPRPSSDPRAPIDPATLEDTRFDARIWRLSPDQYVRESRRLFGAAAPAIELPGSASEDGLTNIAANARIDTGSAARFRDGATTLARWVVAERATRCDPWGTAACAETLLGWLPDEAYRRPATDEERSSLRALYEGLEASYGFDYAIEGVVRAVLLSPEFLYRTEVGAPGARGDVVTLAPYEIANLLAFGITDEAPDAELLAAAEGLADPDVREAQARRLMASSAPVWQRFFWEWLEMATLESQGQEVGLSDAVVAQIEEEYATFVAEIVVGERGTLRDLLSTTRSWARPELAAYYGAEHPGEGLAPVELDPTQRAGLLTRGVWLVSHGKRGRANIVRRGMGIYRDAMCNNITPIDIDLEEALVDLVGEDATVREIVEARGNDPTCGGCHEIADPVGLVFENFSGDGRWQTEYAADGLPVEPQIDLELGTFDSAAEFSQALADDPAFKHCMIQRFAHFLMGIDVGSPRAIRWTYDALTRFDASGGSFEELLVSIVRHPAFVERRREP
ncbi:MAG: DUF1588 domain-containing protein [Myxococcota bacterium]